MCAKRAGNVLWCGGVRSASAAAPVPLLTSDLSGPGIRHDIRRCTAWRTHVWRAGGVVGRHTVHVCQVPTRGAPGCAACEPWRTLAAVQSLELVCEVHERSTIAGVMRTLVCTELAKGDEPLWPRRPGRLGWHADGVRVTAVGKWTWHHCEAVVWVTVAGARGIAGVRCLRATPPCRGNHQLTTRP